MSINRVLPEHSNASIRQNYVSFALESQNNAPIWFPDGKCSLVDSLLFKKDVLCRSKV